MQSLDTRRQLYDPAHWLEDYDARRTDGIAGFVGLDGYRTPSGTLQQGYT